MTQPSNPEARVAAPESRVGEPATDAGVAREDAAAARHLAAARDRDIADLAVKVDANRSAINVLGEQAWERFDRLERTVDEGFTQVRGQLDGAAASLEHIAALLDTLIGWRGGDSREKTPG